MLSEEEKRSEAPEGDHEKSCSELVGENGIQSDKTDAGDSESIGVVREVSGNTDRIEERHEPHDPVLAGVGEAAALGTSRLSPESISTVCSIFSESSSIIVDKCPRASVNGQ